MPDPTVTPPATPKRRRKAKRVPDPTIPRRTRATFLSRVGAMGPTHVAAYRILAEGNPTFAADLKAALDAEAEMHAASDAHIRALRAAKAAEERADAADTRVVETRAILDKLDTLARQIAAARGDVPPADDSHASTVAPVDDAPELD